MQKLSSNIVRFRKAISLCFLALAIISCFSISWVQVIKDISEYLPDDTAAKQGLSIMRKEVKTYANGTALVRGIGKDDAQALRSTIADTEGVLQVDFDANSHSSFKSNNAKYRITFCGPADNQKAIEGLSNLKETLSDYDAVVVSESFSSYSDILGEQMGSVLILVAILVVIVLLLTSTTYAEIPVFLITFIAAALINMGTNFLMGSISFVSNSVAIVLQLALSVDYAIIFCNRYKEEHLTKDIHEAVQSALAHSIPAISASSLTTIAGLAAMSFMDFKLGLDMSVALIKAIIISLLTVFLLMPFLLCTFGKLMDRTAHRSFIPKVDFLGKFAHATRYVIPVVFVVLAGFACYSFSQVKYDFNGNMVNIFNETEERVATREMSEIFGDDYTVALFVPAGDYAKESILIKYIEATSGVIEATGIANIEAMDGLCLGDSIGIQQFMDLSGLEETTVQGLFAYYAAKKADVPEPDFDTFEAPLIDVFECAYELTQNGQADLSEEDAATISDLYGQISQALDQLQGENYSCIAVRNSYPVQGQKTYDFLENLTILARSNMGTDNVYITGDQVSAQGFSSTFTSDMQRVSIISIALVLLILLIAFRSFAMPLMLVAVIEGSIWINFAFAAWTNSYVFFMCYLIVSSIQMGANIDYAIVISTRYTEKRSRGQNAEEAITETMRLALPTVLTSGAMMVFSGLMIALRISDEVIAGMGQYVATGTIITLILVNFALPQILLLGDKVIQKTTVHMKFSASARSTFRNTSLGLLIVGSIAACILPFVQIGSIGKIENETVSSAQTMGDFATELVPIASKIDDTNAAAIQYQYAESLIVEEVGLGDYARGQSEFEEGQRALDEARGQLSAGEDEYQTNLALYNEGKRRLIEGKVAYDKSKEQLAAAELEFAEGQRLIDLSKQEYEDGLAILNAAKDDYAAGEQELADAQQAYDEGMEVLSFLSPVYEMVYSEYVEYQNMLKEYDDAIARGDTETAERLAAFIAKARKYFEERFLGYTLEELLAAYQEAQTDLDDAAAQIAAGRAKLDTAAAEIANGERKMAAAKEEIDAGQAKLDAAEAEIAEGRKQLAEAEKELIEGYDELHQAEQELLAARGELDSAYSQIAEGEAELLDAQTQLSEGKRYLAENKETLDATIAELSNMHNDKDKLKADKEFLMSIPGTEPLAEESVKYADFFSAAARYFSDIATTTQSEATKARVLVFVLCAMALVAFGAIAANLRKREVLAKRLAFGCGIGSVACALMWTQVGIFGWAPFTIGLVLAITAFLFAAAVDTSHASVSTGPRHAAPSSPLKRLFLLK